MSTSAAEQLFDSLKNHAFNRMDDLRNNIALIDGKAHSFSPVANQLIANGTAMPKWIAYWLYSVPKTHSATKSATRLSADFGIDYTPTDLILEDAMLTTSLEKMGNEFADTSRPKAGHALILETAPELRPSLLASADSVNRYYHSLTTATSIIHPRDTYQEFMDEAPAFIAWAKEHEDITLILETAQRIQSLNRDSIESFLSMVDTTQPALRSGLL